MKKLVCLMCLFSISFSSVMPAFAANFAGVATVSTNTVNATQEKEKALYNMILKGIQNKAGLGEESSIDISSLNLEYNKGENMLKEVYQTVVEDHPELFYATSGYGYRYRTVMTPDGSITNTLQSVTPKYRDFASNKQVLEGMQQKFDAEVNKALETIKDVTNPAEKALLLHDYLALHCAYNWETATNHKENAPDFVATAYGALVEKNAVCQGYAYAYKVLLDRAGIETKIASGYAGGGSHAWNVLKIGENWYHVDVTWDDPVADMKGRTRCRYFLISDETMAKDHSGWDAPKCNDTSYEVWANDDFRGPVYKKNDTYYYLNQQYEGKANIVSSKFMGNPSTVTTISIPWYSGVVWRNDCLYYVNMNNDLMCYSLTEKKNTAVAKISFTKKASQDNIYKSDEDGICLEYDEQTNSIVAFSRTTREEVYRYQLK